MLVILGSYEKNLGGKIFLQKKVLAKKKSARYIINVVSELVTVTKEYGSVAQSG